MPNTYLEILKTYWRHAVSSWINFCWIIGSIGAITGSFGSRRHHTSGGFENINLSLLMMGSSFLGWTLWLHFRELIINPTRQFAPRSATPNVLIFTLFASIITLVWPALLVATLFQSFGLIAIATSWFAFLGWASLLLSPVFSLIGMVLFFSLSYFPINSQMAGFLQGDHPHLAAGIILTALLMISIAILRMVRMTADDPRYARKVNYNIWSLRPRVTGEANQIWAQSERFNLPGWMGIRRRVYIPTQNNIWDRARRWRQLNGNMIWSQLFFITVMASVQFRILRGQPLLLHAWSIPFSTILFAMPPISVSQAWMRQWRFLEIELLRPMTRKSFLAELALAIAIDLLLTTAIYAAGVSVLLWQASSLASLEVLLITLFGSLVLMFGWMLWLLRWRDTGVNAFGLLANMLLVFPFFLALKYDAPYHVSAVVAAVTITVIGLFVAHNARRHWPLAELG